IKPGDALGKLVALAQKNPNVIPTLARQLAQEDSIPEAAVPILTKALLDEGQTDFVRSLAVMALVKTDNAAAFEAMNEVLPKLAKSRTGYLKEIQSAALAFMDAPRLENFHQKFEEQAAALNGEQSRWAEQVLIKLAKRKSGAPESRMMTAKALEDGWAASPQRRKQIMSAMMALKTTHRPLEKAVVLAREDADESVRKIAVSTITNLKLDPEKILAEDKPSGPVIATLKGEDVIREVEKSKGNSGRGEQLFVQQGCVSCHTIALGEPLKGPYLGTIAQTYNRKELAEAILYPNKTIAQGFVTSVYTLKDGTTQMGFVVQEGAKAVALRNIAGQEISIAVEQIAKHETDPRSMMPEGLVGNLSVKDFASLLDYLADLAKVGK
ncbi:MAG: c-type cytochrome, partial [Verrucomicrobiota bacterium]